MIMNTRAERPTVTFKRLELRPATGSSELNVKPDVSVELESLTAFQPTSPVMCAGMSLVKMRASLPTRYVEYINHDIKEKGRVPQCLGDNPGVYT